MQIMAGGVWLSSVVALLYAAFVVAHNPENMKTNTYHVSVGYLFILKCRLRQTNVTWNREGSHNQSLPAGVEARGALLYFLPVQMSHNGSYTCEKRDDTKVKMTFSVLVSRDKCPEPLDTNYIAQGDNFGIPCKLKEIFRLKTTQKVQWMKDCRPVERERRSVYLNESIILSKASAGDAGTYTCLVDVRLDGRTYTAARSMQLVIKSGPPDSVFQDLQVLYPKQDVLEVEVGTRAELKCEAHVGFIEDDEMFMYWTFNTELIMNYAEFKESWKFVHKASQVYSESTLSISNVRREFLNTPFQCHVMSPADKKDGMLYLQEADRSALHITVALCLSASLTALAFIAAFQFWKTDLLLAFRNLSRRFTKQEAPRWKLYDAYVSYLHPHNRSKETAEFVLQILPEKLETQHGYSLYIRGRDDSPGEAVHDVIATAVSQCQRLIIVLSADDNFSVEGDSEGEPLWDQSQLCYEQSIGLHDALLMNDPKVILVEIGLVDYSGLPESLRYIKRKQGSLKWRKPSAGAHRLSKMHFNRSFWKHLRYYMPSVRVRKPSV